MRLDIKPLSVNKAFQGRRFKSPEYKSYEEECLWLLKGNEKVSGWVEVTYHFHIKNFKRVDVGNYEKLISDIIVKAGLIDDDRFIKKMTLEKHQIEKDEWIEIIIEEI